MSGVSKVELIVYVNQQGKVIKVRKPNGKPLDPDTDYFDKNGPLMDEQSTKGAALESPLWTGNPSKHAIGTANGKIELVAYINEEGEVISVFHHDPNNPPIEEGAPLGDPDYDDPSRKMDDVVFGASLESAERPPDTGFNKEYRKRTFI